MDKTTAQRLVRETFKAAFDKSRFRDFVNELCNGFNEDKKLFSVPVPDAFAPHVKSCQRLGTFESGEGELADVLVVHLTDSYKLERTRTALRDFVAHTLKRDHSYKEAGLVAFVAPDSESWRFSFVQMEYETGRDPSTGKIKPEERLTPARRYSYLVGTDEECHTAQTRFLALLQNTTDRPALAQFEEAFSVESVTDEFFGEYARLFEATQAALESVVRRNKAIRDEFKTRSVSTADFAKKLLGQIVFLYFVQKKGWLGVPLKKKWGEGPRNFLRQIADQAVRDKSSLFNDVLEPLFYDTLASDRGHDAWCPSFQCRIPFLNGGLFEPLAGYDWEGTEIDLPNLLFTNQVLTEDGDTGSGIFDVFDRYNFTVNEAEPLEQEVAIDPEMLGKVFENLIEENRRKGLGAYYTPRDIVHYMCQESLITYLDTALNRNTQLIQRTEVETLVRHGEQAAHYETARRDGSASSVRHLPASIENNARELDEALKSITVCDPAIGSGAFPVGMMTEIVRARSALTPYFNDVTERTPYYFKRHAIQTSLFGSDLDPGAVEIAKLRLWLSLVVDEVDVEQIKPLPNLDYKVVVGDSLGGVEKNLFNRDQFEQLEVLKPKFFDESNRAKKARYKEQIELLINDLTNGRAVFDFEIYFSEVFHRNGGFDVVVANPPYISVEKFARTALQADWKRKFKTYAARGDIYCFFYEKGFSLLRSGGVLTFISSNKFQRTGYGKGLRQLLVGQQILSLIDFCELPVFAASTDPMIVIATKAAAIADREFSVLVVKDESEFTSLPSSVVSHGSRYRPGQLKAEGWSLEGGLGFALLEKIRIQGTSLATYVGGRFYYGIKTGLNDAFVIDRETRDRLIKEDRKSAELIRPWIRGRDIKRWTHEYADLYVIRVRYGFHTELKKYPAILRHLTKFEKQLKARGQCKTSRSGGAVGQHHWLEWDNNPSPEYLAVFEQDRVTLPTIKKTHGFSFIKGGSCSNNKTALFVSEDAHFLLAVMNASITEWIVKMEFPSLGDPWSGGRIEYPAARVKSLPIPPASTADKTKLARLAEAASVAAAKHDSEAVTKADRQIDEIIYRLFKLNSGEIAQIETALKASRGDNEPDDEGADD